MGKDIVVFDSNLSDVELLKRMTYSYPHWRKMVISGQSDINKLITYVLSVTTNRDTQH